MKYRFKSELSSAPLNTPYFWKNIHPCVKALLNNIGYCAHPDCGQIIYGSKRNDFKNSVTAHWRRSHSDEAVEHVGNLVKILSDIPVISNDEAQKRVSSLSHFTSCNSAVEIVGTEVIVGTSEDGSSDVESDDESDVDELDGPYKCSECDFSINCHTGYSRAMLQHWVTRHDPDPRSLVFTDTPTGREVRAGALFDKVARCSVPGCGQVFGNNGPDFALNR